MSTHRVIQLSVLLDTLESLSRVSQRAASNAARIRNDKAASHFLRRAGRLSRIADKCRARLEVS